MSDLILVFGGSFDPVHQGHIHALHTALSTLNPQRLLIVPTYLNPQKSQSRLSAKQRVGCLKTCLPPLIEGLIQSDRIEISHIEVDEEKPCYTVHTLRRIQESHEDARIIFLMGSDSFFQLHTWKRYKEIIQQYRLFVVKRCEAVLADYQRYIDDHLAKGIKGIIIAGNTPVEASSSQYWIDQSTEIPKTVQTYLAEQAGESL